MVAWTNILSLLANMSRMHRRCVRTDLSIGLPYLDGVFRRKTSYSNLAQQSVRSIMYFRRILQLELCESTA